MLMNEQKKSEEDRHETRKKRNDNYIHTAKEKSAEVFLLSISELFQMAKSQFNLQQP